jgi:hypothetical protein
MPVYPGAIQTCVLRQPAEKLMALLAEEIVEEWLNRNGYFTIRGIKLGVHEIDLLAIAVRGSAI